MHTINGLVIFFILQVFHFHCIRTEGEGDVDLSAEAFAGPLTPAKLGQEALENLIREKVIDFDDGPYFSFSTEGDKLASYVEHWALKNFSLITSGKSKYNEGDFWVENEAFSYNGTIEAERVTGVVGLAIEMIEGLAQVKTPGAEEPVLCRVIGSSREFSPLGRAYDYYGNPAIKVLFQDTVIKKPFPHVVNDYILDSSTRPIYPIYNGSIAQPFHFNFQMDPKCPLGLNRTEIEIVDSSVDHYLKPLMRELLMKQLIRKGYYLDAIQPYAQSIGAELEEDIAVATQSGSYENGKFTSAHSDVGCCGGY